MPPPAMNAAEATAETAASPFPNFLKALPATLLAERYPKPDEFRTKEDCAFQKNLHVAISKALHRDVGGIAGNGFSKIKCHLRVTDKGRGVPTKDEKARVDRILLKVCIDPEINRKFYQLTSSPELAGVYAVMCKLVAKKAFNLSTNKKYQPSDKKGADRGHGVIFVRPSCLTRG